MQERGIELTAL